jgi:hypothetical protein
MTRDQVDELMRENGIVVVGEAVYILCNLVEAESAAAEREACAKVAENGRFLHDDSPEAKFGKACAAAIRARGQHE